VTGLAAALRGATFHDVSPLLDERTPVFPGHPPLTVDGSARTHERDGYFLQALTLGEHTGSHVDAPAHAVATQAGETIDTFPIERFIAPYVKYDLSAFAPEPGELVPRSRLEEVEARDGIRPEAGDVAIVQFGWDRHLRPEAESADEREWWVRNAPGLAADACEHLAGLGVVGVGSDTATCDAAVVDGRITSAVGHLEHFLPRGILLFEGLVGLGRAPARGVFVGLPLRIRGGSGSPIRAVLIAERNAS